MFRGNSFYPIKFIEEKKPDFILILVLFSVLGVESGSPKHDTSALLLRLAFDCVYVYAHT